MRREDKELLHLDIHSTLKEEKKSIWIKIFPWLLDIIEKVVEKYLNRKGYI